MMSKQLTVAVFGPALFLRIMIQEEINSLSNWKGLGL